MAKKVLDNSDDIFESSSDGDEEQDDYYEDDDDGEGPDDGEPDEDDDDTVDGDDDEDDDDDMPSKFKGDKQKRDKSYRELERQFTVQSQENAQLKQQLNQLAPMIQQLLSQQQQEQKPKKVELNKEKWEEKFADDPMDAIRELLEATVGDIDTKITQSIQPVQQFLSQQELQRNMVNEVNSLRSKHPDFDDYEDEIRGLINNPVYQEYLTKPGAMEFLYNTAKVMNPKRSRASREKAIAQKKGAKVSTKQAKPTGRKTSQGDEVVDQIFGGSKRSRKIFD
jgi:hypothetical protein